MMRQSEPASKSISGSIVELCEGDHGDNDPSITATEETEAKASSHLVFKLVKRIE